MTARFLPGMRIRVPWGRSMHREGHVIEVWGDPEDPDQVRVELDPFDPDDPDEYPSDLLLPPYVVTPAAAA